MNQTKSNFAFKMNVRINWLKRNILQLQQYVKDLKFENPHFLFPRVFANLWCYHLTRNMSSSCLEYFHCLVYIWDIYWKNFTDLAH